MTFIFYVYLLRDKNIEIDFFKSVLSDTQIGDNTIKFILSLVWPITLTILIINKQIKIKQMKNYIITALLVLITGSILFSIGTNEISYYNQSQKLNLSFNQQLSERLVVLDKMNKKLANKMQIAKIVDTSYYKNLIAVTLTRKDGPQVMWKWAQENNPNINFGEVSQFYMELVASVENERNNLYLIETTLQNTKLEYDLLHNQFPSNLYLLYQTKELQYTSIASDDSKQTNTTGIDNQTKIK